MKTRHAFLSALGLIIGIAKSSQASDVTFTTIEFPGADATTVTGISGNNVAGYYLTNGATGAQSQHSFLYNGSTFKTLDFPGVIMPRVTGISGSTVVGYYEYNTNFEYQFQGFIYDGSTFTTLIAPGSFSTFPTGISGGTVIGYYNGTNAFIYNGSTFTTINFPGARPGSTQLKSISGTTISGIYSSNGVSYAFTYDGATFTTTLDLTPMLSALPGSEVSIVTSGNIVVGSYLNEAANSDLADLGFVYDGSTFTTVNFPGMFSTQLYGITGNTFFGSAVTYQLIYENIEPFGLGFVAQLQPPVLQISLTRSNTFLASWPYPSTGWSLQQNNGLTTTNWVASTNIVANDGANNFIIAAKSSGRLFFRLKN